MKNVILFLCMMAHLCCFGTKYEKAAGRLATRLFSDSVASRFMFEQIAQTDGGKDLLNWNLPAIILLSGAVRPMPWLWALTII